jgi:hypothetical protein
VHKAKQLYVLSSPMAHRITRKEGMQIKACKNKKERQSLAKELGLPAVQVSAWAKNHERTRPNKNHLDVLLEQLNK